MSLMPKTKRPKLETISLKIPGHIYTTMAEIARAADVTPTQVIQVFLAAYMREIKRHVNEPEAKRADSPRPQEKRRNTSRTSRKEKP